MKKIFLLNILFTSFLFAQLDLADKNTIALYLFDEGVGDTVHDSSVNNLYGVINGGTVWAPHGGVTITNGRYIEIPHNDLLNPNDSSWTIEIVFRTQMDKLINESPTKTTSMLSKNDGDFSNGFNIHFNWQDEMVYVLLDDSTNTSNFIAGTPYNFLFNKEQHHLALVYNKEQNNLKIYLDNQLGQSVKANLKGITPKSPLLIGKYEQGNDGFVQYFWGVVHKLKISNIAREPLEFITDVDDTEEQYLVSNSFRLNQNYPNPFNPSTIISYEISKGNFVSLKVYNVLGKEVATLVNNYMSAGQYKVTFDAAELSSGVYIYRLKSGNINLSKIMIMQK